MCCSGESAGIHQAYSPAMTRKRGAGGGYAGQLRCTASAEGEPSSSQAGAAIIPGQTPMKSGHTRGTQQSRSQTRPSARRESQGQAAAQERKLAEIKGTDGETLVSVPGARALTEGKTSLKDSRLAVKN